MTKDEEEGCVKFAGAVVSLILYIPVLMLKTYVVVRTLQWMEVL